MFQFQKGSTPDFTKLINVYEVYADGSEVQERGTYCQHPGADREDQRSSAWNELPAAGYVGASERSLGRSSYTGHSESSDILIRLREILRHTGKDDLEGTGVSAV